MNPHDYMKRIGRQPAPGVPGEDLWQCQAADCLDKGTLHELSARPCPHVTQPGEQQANLLDALEGEPTADCRVERTVMGPPDPKTPWPPFTDGNALTMGKLVAICTSLGRLGGLTKAVMTVAPNLVRWCATRWPRR